MSNEAQNYSESLTGNPSNSTVGMQCETYVWGSNSSHQLVEGNKDKILTPKKSTSFKDAIQVIFYLTAKCYLFYTQRIGFKSSNYHPKYFCLNK